jgi:hypothetical protein
LLNSKAQQLLNSIPQNYALAHDWWAAQVISLYGKIFFNDTVDTHYRIHSANAVGLPGTLDRIKKSLSRNAGTLSRQALEILEYEAAVDNSKIIEIKAMQSHWEQISSGSKLLRLKIALMGRKARKSALEDLWRRAILFFRSH